MPLETEGSLSATLDAAEELIAASAEFQSQTGAADATEAKDYIHWGRADESEEAQDRPRCIIRFPDELDVEQLSTSGFNTNGSILAVFELTIDSDYIDDFRERYKWCTNKIGKILDEMKTTAGSRSAPYLHATGFELFKLGPSNPKKNNNENFAVGAFLLHYSGE